jgi:hypothetical protein
MSPLDDPRTNTESRQQARPILQDQRHVLHSSTDRNDKAWVHWEYRPDEWALFDKIDWSGKSPILWVLAGGNAVFLLATMLSWYILNPVTGRVWEVFVPALLSWMAFLCSLIIYIFPYSDARKRHKARQKQPQTVTFSKQGVWEAGAYFPFNEGSDVVLQTVTLTSHPSVLHFHLKKVYGNSSESPPLTVTLRVLVPHGQEGEAGLLLKRFQTEVIQARQQEEKRRLNPPEPH